MEPLAPAANLPPRLNLLLSVEPTRSHTYYGATGDMARLREMAQMPNNPTLLRRHQLRTG